MKFINIFSPVLLLVVTLLFLTSGSAFATQGLITESGNGSVDWGQGTAFGSSSVIPMEDSIDPLRTHALAVRQAGVQARKNLLSAVLGISIDGEKNVQDNLAEDYKFLSELRGYIQNSFLETKVDDDGQVEVKASVSLRSDISSVIFPASVPFLSGIAPSLGFSATNATMNLQQSMHDVTDVVSASGIIIDARSIDVKPALLPTVYGSDGVGLYGAFAVSRSKALSKGLIGYYTDSQSSEVFARVGSNPLRVTAVRSQGKFNTGMILSIGDSSRFKAAMKNGIITTNCAVAVIVTADTSDNNPDPQVEIKDGASSADDKAVKAETPEDNLPIIEESLVPEKKSDEIK